MVILADTSIWIGHLRIGNTLLKGFLEEGSVLMHPCVEGELALGTLKSRPELLNLLGTLPKSEVATDEEVRYLIEKKKLWGLGIGWVDVQLLASTLLTKACELWTGDAPLRKACERAQATLFHGDA